MKKAITFIKESYSELKKVNWPSRNQTINYTLIVITASIVVAVFLGLLDLFFSSMIEQMLA